MIASLTNLLSELFVDEPIAYGKVRLYPLRLRSASNLEYLTIGDSGSEGLVSVEEISASGSVPELRVHNRAKCRLLIPEGSTLIGAKQNRVVNLSVLLAPESTTVIPVSCVERGRWRFVTPHFAAAGFADSPLRAKMCKRATKSLEETGKVHVDQAEVWSHVDGMLGGANAYSSTAAYHALYEKWQPELADYEAQLRLPENTCGVAVEIDDRLEAVDLFDKPNTLHALWPRLVSSYLLAALRPGTPHGKKTDLKTFLQRVLSSAGNCHESVGVGTTIRLTSDEAVAAALVCEGQLVHLSAFANGVTSPARGEPAVSPTGENKPTGQPKRSKARRPWWRFWA
jgi:hypothetical protein